MTADQPADPDAPPELEEEFHRVREGFEDVPSLEQFEILEALASRLEVVVKPAQREGQCIDAVTGSPIDPALAREILELGDVHHWELNAAQAHQAEIVAAIADHADWRSVDTVQRRALSAWHLHYPELTYGTIMHLGPQMARRRLQLHHDLQQRSEPGLTLRPRARQDPADIGGTADDMPEGAAVTPAAVTTPVAGLQSYAASLPAGLYALVDNLDDAVRQKLRADGLQPPDDAAGFMVADPYNTVNTLHELVIGYLDKLELPVPTGGASETIAAVARYNDLDGRSALSVGQIIWFPERKVLQSWLSASH